MTGRGTLANWISEPGEERRAIVTLGFGFVASFLAVGWAVAAAGALAGGMMVRFLRREVV